MALSPNLNPLGQYVTQRRKVLGGWSMAELHRRSGVAYNTLRNIEQNKKPVKPKETTIRALAAALATEGKEQEELDMLLILAGYGIPISQSAEERQHSLDVFFESHPEWRKELLLVQGQMTPTQQEQSLQALRVVNRMQLGEN